VLQDGYLQRLYQMHGQQNIKNCEHFLFMFLWSAWWWLSLFVKRCSWSCLWNKVVFWL